MNDEELFLKEYYSKIEPSKEYQEAYKLWLWYHYHCEKYDSQICTGKSKYEDYMPASDLESKLITLNAMCRLKEINNERLKLASQSIHINEKDWLNAKRHFGRYKLKGLEEEYNHYWSKELC